jgi:hypothetical protein
MTIDTLGNRHASAGTPGGGQFAAKRNQAPAATLAASPESHAARRGVTLVRGDFGGFGMAHLHEYVGPEGQAFSATLTLDGSRVGEVIQEGNGERTWCRFTSVDAEDAYYRLVFERWDFERDVYYKGEVHEEPHDDASVLDELYQAVSFQAQLAQQRRKGNLPILTAGDLDRVEQNDHVTSFRTIAGTANDLDAARDELRQRGDLSGALYWDGEMWLPFEDTEGRA